MLQTNKKQRLAGFIMLSMTAIFWGAGFVLNDNLLDAAFSSTPNMINTIRFGVAAIVLGIVFARKLRFNRKTLLYAGVGSVMLSVAFTLQLIGLKYTTPSHNGFFTAAYVIFVPFLTWIFYKKRPDVITFVGVIVAVGGLALLNIDGQSGAVSDTIVGDLLTLAGALLFASQIVWTNYTYSKQEIDYTNMTFWQVLFAFVLLAVYSAIFEIPHLNNVTFDPSYCIWRFALISIGGTAFAYFAQSYALEHLAPTETSLVLACESPIGALLSTVIGIEAFAWNTAVGGALVIAAVVIIELTPHLLEKRKARQKKDDQSSTE